MDSGNARAYMPQSKKTDYETPHDLFDRLDVEFGPFTLDPCGQREHYSASRCVTNGGHFYDGSTEAMDGLLQPWNGRVYCNPPYGREIAGWVEKAVTEVENGNAELVVSLLPVRTDTRWWQTFVVGGFYSGKPNPGKWRPCWLVKAWRECGLEPPVVEVRFLAGRLRFGGTKASAPFPSAVVVWRNGG